MNAGRSLFLPSLLASLLPSSYRYRPEGEARREASEARRQARDERNEMRDRRLAREPIIVQFFPAVTNDFLFLCLGLRLSFVSPSPLVPSVGRRFPAFGAHLLPPSVGRRPLRGVVSEPSEGTEPRR